MTELERVELNAIIHNQRETLRELNETRDILRKEKRILEKKLEIATKALKEYANSKPTEWMTCVTADNALKEMEGVK